MPVVRRDYPIFLACCAAVFAATAAPNARSDDVPRVIGFERMYATAGSDDVAAGQLLLGELNCTSCHAADSALATAIQRKPAPVLDTVGSRVRPQYLLKFLADPQATKPGTTMPTVLSGKPEIERGPIVEALVHFLASTGSLSHANPSRHAVNRGEKLFHSIGCVACHDPRNESLPTPQPTSISLGTPSRKLTLPGLTQFLQDPLAVRPGGRMPHLNLTAAEARDIASFLLNDLDIVSGLQYAYYEGSWEKLPKFDTLTPVAVGDAETFDLSPAMRKDHFALRFEGTIHLPQEGDYLFLIGSDDGSRLLIDDKLIVANDGIHPFEQKRKKVKMAAGLHSVVVEYFEDEGEESLQVDFEGPGQSQQPLDTLLTTPSKQPGTAPSAEAFEIDPAKAAKGREYFATLGCASCHSLRIDGSLIPSTKTALPLSGINSHAGCLAGRSPRSPNYSLSERQRTALTAAIVAAKSPQDELSPTELVNRTLVRFNCVACHEREKLGGILAARDAYFLSDMPEMGDEGRIPPSLTGVGAKLNADWLKALFDHGAKDRPYMLTRMPKVGTANVGELIQAFEAADAAHFKSAPNTHISQDDARRYKAAGRRLVGAQGFSCIKCHTFAGQRSTGIQAISLTTMTKRLRPDWFHHYLQSPLAYRPGTRMPSAFPDGQTTLPGVLDGTVNGQIAALWSYLGDGDNAVYPVGLVTGKIELIAFDEAVVYRNFIEGVGPRAIGVGYPEKLNLAFDAEQCRLALLWHGGFIDAARHWSARGAGFEKPLGDNILRLPEGPPFAVLPDENAKWPGATLTADFRGYKLGEKGKPMLLYEWEGLTIEDTPQPVGQDDLFSIQRTLNISGKGPFSNAWFRALRANQIEETGDGSYKIDGRWVLNAASGRTPIRRKQQDEWELLVPVVLDGGKCRIELNYDW
jgi:mono/diheme cytochrome c family protein